MSEKRTSTHSLQNHVEGQEVKTARLCAGREFQVDPGKLSKLRKAGRLPIVSINR
jgi:hypothetical protein